MASWSATATQVEAPRLRPRSRPHPRTVAARRPLNPLRSGVTWIIVLATLLAGIVALNVAVLQLNVRLSSLSRERASLRSDNASLQSQLSSEAATPRIQSLALRRLGLVPAPANATMFVELGGR
jgi:cell division protein FtsL